DQDGADASSVFGSHVDRGQQDQRGFGGQVEGVGDGDEHGHAIDRPQTGQHADQGAQEGAQGRNQQVHPRKSDIETDAQMVDDLAHDRNSRGPSGSTTSSARSNSRKKSTPIAIPLMIILPQLPPNRRPISTVTAAVAMMKPRVSKSRA